MAVQILKVFCLLCVCLAVVAEHTWHTQTYLAVLDSPRIHIEQRQNKWLVLVKESWGSNQTNNSSCVCGVYQQTLSFN